MATETDWSQYLLKRYKYWEVYLHDDQTYLGRLVIALNREGNLDPFAETTAEERAELEIIIIDVQRTLTELYQPNMINYANLRNVWHHCHWHIIPRYETSRVVAGQEFFDEKWGRNYTPHDTTVVSREVLEHIKNDFATRL